MNLTVDRWEGQLLGSSNNGDKEHSVGYNTNINESLPDLKSGTKLYEEMGYRDTNESSSRLLLTVYHTAAIRAYSIAVPLLIGLCWFGIGANLFVLSLLMNRVRKWNLTLKLTTSLAVIDALTLFQISFGLLVNSYLPLVLRVHLPPTFKCWMFVIEAVRLGGIESSVLHILGLTLNQCLSVSQPVAYNRMATNRRVHLAIILNLFLMPILFYLGIFLYNYQYTFAGAEPSEGLVGSSNKNNETLTSNNNNNNNTDGKSSQHQQRCLPIFLLGATFRSIVFGAVLIPLLIVAVAYVKIVVTLRRLRKRLDRFSCSASAGGSSKRISNHQQPKSDQNCYRRNCQMAKSIALIIGTFVLGWAPGPLWLILTQESGPYPINSLRETHPHIVYTVGITVNFLIILKSVLNPLIYAYRVQSFAAADQPAAAPSSKVPKIAAEVAMAKNRGRNFRSHRYSMIPFLVNPNENRDHPDPPKTCCCCINQRLRITDSFLLPDCFNRLCCSVMLPSKMNSSTRSRNRHRNRNSAVVHSCSDCTIEPLKDSMVFDQPPEDYSSEV